MRTLNIILVLEILALYLLLPTPIFHFFFIYEGSISLFLHVQQNNQSIFGVSSVDKATAVDVATTVFILKVTAMETREC